MKNYEVGIIVAAVVIIGYLWWKNQGVATITNPTNATSPGYMPGTITCHPTGAWVTP